MKRFITMILTMVVTISCILTLAFTAKADANSTTENDATSATKSPTETKQLKQMKIKAKEEGRVYTNGKIVPVTKGFTVCLSLENPDGKKVKKAYGNKVLRSKEDYKGEVKWTSSKPDIASVSVTGVVSGKKYGKSTITAEYGGRTSYVIVQVKKNVFTAQPKVTYGEESYEKGDYIRVTKILRGVTSMYFDKKGNLIYRIYHKSKLTKAGKKHHKKYPDAAVYKKKFFLHYGSSHGKIGCKITLKNQNGKVVGKTREKILIIHDFKYKAHVKKYKIKKKNIKANLKNIDLRRCKLNVCDGVNIES